MPEYFHSYAAYCVDNTAEVLELRGMLFQYKIKIYMLWPDLKLQN